MDKVSELMQVKLMDTLTGTEETTTISEVRDRLVHWGAGAEETVYKASFDKLVQMADSLGFLLHTFKD